MPHLDVSFMTADPMLADTFKVERRMDIVGTNGRTIPTVTATFKNVVGVVTQQDPADLVRNDDGQFMPRLITICSRFSFHGVSPGGQPDLITWNGSQYVVKHLVPYSRFGRGTYEIVAEAMVAVGAVQ